VHEYASCQGEALVFLDLEAVRIGSVSERLHGYDLVVIPVFPFLVPTQRSRIRRLVAAVVTGARRRVEAQKVRRPSSAIVRDRVSEVLWPLCHITDTISGTYVNHLLLSRRVCVRPSNSNYASPLEFCRAVVE
jgi:hypothetical protein